MGKKKPKVSLQRPLPDKERWYRLDAMFDDADIKMTPIKGAWFRGPLGKVTLVEVKADFPQDQYGPLAKWLEDNGVEAMVVKEGVRFLKIAPADKNEQAVLESHYIEELAREKAASEATKVEPPAETNGAGVEP